MQKLLYLFLISLLVNSCATAKQTYTSDGNLGYTISCNGSILDWGNCYEKAGELCGKKGYVILNKNGETGSTLTANDYGLYGGSVMYRSMVIRCKD